MFKNYLFLLILTLPFTLHPIYSSSEPRETIYVYNPTIRSQEFFLKTVQALEHSTQLDVQPITKEDLFKDTWVNVAHTIVFPGAPTSQYIDELGKSGIKILKSAINEFGIKFLGICGGAVLGCASNEYNMPGFTIQRESGMLGFSPNHCKGPYRIVGTPTLIEIYSGNNIFPTMYYGGSYFLTSNPEQIIATYPDRRVAILQPRDNVILCGPHPELEIHESNDKETQRKHFWHTLLTRLEIPLQVKN